MSGFQRALLADSVPVAYKIFCVPSHSILPLLSPSLPTRLWLGLDIIPRGKLNSLAVAPASGRGRGGGRGNWRDRRGVGESDSEDHAEDDDDDW